MAVIECPVEFAPQKMVLGFACRLHVLFRDRAPTNGSRSDNTFAQPQEYSQTNSWLMQHKKSLNVIVPDNTPKWLSNQSILHYTLEQLRHKGKKNMRTAAERS